MPLHTVEEYPSLKRKDILTIATTWMNPEDVGLSERSQSQRDKSCMILLIQGPKRSQMHEDRKWNGGVQGLGSRAGE